MVLLQPFLLKKISPYFLGIVFGNNFNSVAIVESIEPRTLFHIGMASLWSYYNLNFGRIYLLLFLRIFYLATISIASPLFYLKLQNLFHIGMASLWPYYLFYWKLYLLLFLSNFYLATISIASPLFYLELQNLFHIGMASTGLTTTFTL